MARGRPARKPPGVSGGIPRLENEPRLAGETPARQQACALNIIQATLKG